MKLRKLMSVLTLALFLLPSMPFIAADPVPSIVIDEFYEPGEKVEVSGVAGAGVEVYLLVMFGEALIYEETLTADEDGEFSTEFLLPEDASEGLYTVTVSSEEEDAKVSFTVVNEDAEEEEEVEAEEEEETGEEETEDAVQKLNDKLVGLENAIYRAELFIDKIWAMVDRLRDRGYEIDDEEVENQLKPAKDLLDEAKVHLLLENFNPSEATKNLGGARGHLGMTMAWLQKTARGVKQNKAQEFLEGVEEDITNLQEKIARLEAWLEQDDMVQAALETKLRHLERLRARLEAGETEEVMDELENVVQGVDEDLDDLDDEETAERFKAMNRVEARIRVLTRLAEILLNKGEDTTVINELIMSNQGLIEKFMNDMQEGRDGKLDDLLGLAEEDLKDLGIWIRDFMKSKAGRKGLGSEKDN